MRTSSRALLWVILVFAAGILFGTALTLIIVRPERGLGADIASVPAPQTEPEAQPPDTDAAFGDDRRGQLVARIIRQLNLDPSQAAAVRKILEESRSRQQRLERRRRLALGNIRRQTLREIRAVLNPEQQQELEQILRRLNQRRRLRD